MTTTGNLRQPISLSCDPWHPPCVAETSCAAGSQGWPALLQLTCLGGFFLVAQLAEQNRTCRTVGGREMTALAPPLPPRAIALPPLPSRPLPCPSSDHCAVCLYQSCAPTGLCIIHLSHADTPELLMAGVNHVEV
jgi:hypothetical protein